MNDTDVQKVREAIPIVDSIEGQLNNLIKRIPGAMKAWEAEIVYQSNAAAKAKLKDGILPGAKNLAKLAKAALKDVGAIYKEGKDAKKLAGYATGKDFRTKAIKWLSTSKALDDASAKFQVELLNILGGGMFPGMSNADCIASLNALKTFTTYYNAIRVELGKL